MKKNETIINNFIIAIREYIKYWDSQPINSKEKLEGLTHSILCLLDGISGNFDGDIEDIAKNSKDLMLHDCLYSAKVK